MFDLIAERKIAEAVSRGELDRLLRLRIEARYYGKVLRKLGRR